MQEDSIPQKELMEKAKTNKIKIQMEDAKILLQMIQRNGKPNSQQIKDYINKNFASQYQQNLEKLLRQLYPEVKLIKKLKVNRQNIQTIYSTIVSYYQNQYFISEEIVTVIIIKILKNEQEKQVIRAIQKIQKKQKAQKNIIQYIKQKFNQIEKFQKNRAIILQLLQKLLKNKTKNSLQDKLKTPQGKQETPGGHLNKITFQNKANEDTPYIQKTQQKTVRPLDQTQIALTFNNVYKNLTEKYDISSKLILQIIENKVSNKNTEGLDNYIQFNNEQSQNQLYQMINSIQKFIKEPQQRKEFLQIIRKLTKNKQNQLKEDKKQSNQNKMRKSQIDKKQIMPSEDVVLSDQNQSIKSQDDERQQDNSFEQNGFRNQTQNNFSSGAPSLKKDFIMKDKQKKKQITKDKKSDFQLKEVKKPKIKNVCKSTHNTSVDLQKRKINNFKQKKLKNQKKKLQKEVQFQYDEKQLQKDRPYSILVTIVEKEQIKDINLYCVIQQKNKQIIYPKQIKMLTQNAIKYLDNYYYGFLFKTNQINECYKIKYKNNSLINTRYWNLYIYIQQNKPHQNFFPYIQSKNHQRWLQNNSKTLNFSILIALFFSFSLHLQTYQLTQYKFSQLYQYNQSSHIVLNLLFKWMNIFSKYYDSQSFIDQSEQKIDFKQNNKNTGLIFKLLLSFLCGIHGQSIAENVINKFNLDSFYQIEQYNQPSKFEFKYRQQIERRYVSALLKIQLYKNSTNPQKKFSGFFRKKLFFQKIKLCNDQLQNKKQILSCLKTHPQIVDYDLLTDQLLKNEYISVQQFFNIATCVLRFRQDSNYPQNIDKIVTLLNNLCKKIEKKHFGILQIQRNQNGSDNIFLYKDKHNEMKFRIDQQNFTKFQSLLMKICEHDKNFSENLYESYHRPYLNLAISTVKNKISDFILLYFRESIFLDIHKQVILKSIRQDIISLQEIQLIFSRLFSLNCIKNQTLIKDILSQIIKKNSKTRPLNQFIQLFQIYQNQKSSQDQKSFDKIYINSIKNFEFDFKLSIRILKGLYISPKVQQPFYKFYTQYLVKNKTKQQRQKLYEQVQPNLKLSQHKKTIIKIISFDNIVDKEQIKKLVFEKMINCPQKLLILSYNCNQILFSEALLEIVLKISNFQITSIEIKKIKKNLQDIEKNLSQFNQFRNLKQEIFKSQKKIAQYQTKLKKLKEFSQCYSTKNSFFSEVLQEITKIQQKILRQNFETASKNSSLISQLIQKSQDIINLKLMGFWKEQNIQSFKNVLEQIQNIKVQFKQNIDQFIYNKINLNKFQKFFPSQKIGFILKFANCVGQFAERIKQAQIKIDSKNIENIKKKVSSLAFIIQKLQVRQLPLKQWQQFLGKRKEGQINLKNCLQTIDKIEKILKQNKLYEIDYKDQIFKVVINSGQAKEVFQFIENYKINEKSIVDLKQYFNDLQYTTLKFQDICQFQEVVLYWKKVLTCKSFNDYITQLRNLLKKRKITLSKKILNSLDNLEQIKRRIKELENRQTSFKYQIEKIFENSKLSINVSKSNQIEIEIEILIQSKESLVKQQTIPFKILSTYKQKSQLLITDFKKQKYNHDNQNKDKLNENSNQDQKNIQVNDSHSKANIIEIFQKYFQFYKQVYKINICCKELINYGYDPQEIKFQGRIINSDYQFLKQKAKYLQFISKDWKNSMIQVYKQSFLLTHYIGPQLNNFIICTLSKIYTLQLMEIANISEQQFENQIKKSQFIFNVNNEKQLIPKKKLKLVNQFYQNLLKNKKLNYFQFSQKKQLNIRLIHCHQMEFYSCIYDEDNDKKPEINYILYCQQDTEWQQIQIFIIRSKLMSHKKFFIVGLHYLRSQIQIAFCDLLHDYFFADEVIFKENNLANLTFIDNSQKEKVYLYLLQQRKYVNKISITPTELQKRSDLISNQLLNTIIIESSKPGLGKTFQAEKLSKNSNIQYFSVAGNISFERLALRLKDIIRQNRKLNQNGKKNRNLTLLIQIGHIQNQQKLEIFLYQIIVYRCFNHKGFIYLPKDTQILIEIQNIYKEQNKQEYNILKILRKDQKKFIFIEKFSLQNLYLKPNKYEDKFVLNYLNMISNKQIINKNLKTVHSCSTPQNWKQLIQKYFLQKIKDDPTYSLYRSFMDMLYTSFKVFGDTAFFDQKDIQELHYQIRRLDLDKFRLNFLQICINNTIQFLQQTSKSNLFDNNEMKENFSNRISSCHLLILASYTESNFRFVYLDQNFVDNVIKNFIVTQSIQNHPIIIKDASRQNINKLFDKQSLTKFQSKRLEQQIFSILHDLSGNKIFALDPQQIKRVIKNFDNYCFTLDNFFKMCLIIQRSLSKIPIVIMGQSGVGKTSLLKFLAQEVLQQELMIFNIHAGINQKSLIQFVDKIFKKSKEINNLTLQEQIQLKRLTNKFQLQRDFSKNTPQQEQKIKQIKQQIKELKMKSKRLWVFFDQFNTTDELSYIKQMMIDKRFQGRLLPQNIVFVAACNPYRKKQEKRIQRAGIKKKIGNMNEFAFRVKPPTLSLVQYMWDYQQLGKQQNKQYIKKILSSIQYDPKIKLVRAISQIHQYYKSNEQISSVSLRDVARFKQLYKWFFENVPQIPFVQPGSLQKQKFINENYSMRKDKRALILTFCFCYSLRLASNQERNQLFRTIQRELEFQEGIMKKTLQNEQIDYVCRLKKAQDKIALNTALRENVFTTLVCIMNKIPLLIIGNPGSSKSLSIKFIASNFQGQNSKNSQFCRKFPQINMLYFQGSQSCNSDGVQAIFQKGYRRKKQSQRKHLTSSNLKKKLQKQSKQEQQSLKSQRSNSILFKSLNIETKQFQKKNENELFFSYVFNVEQKEIQNFNPQPIQQKAIQIQKFNNQPIQQKVINTIQFDQIGLAEKSVHNPLKVLHSKLETHQKQLAFVGVSNWQLDAAKMSRCLLLARASPDEKQLKQTSLKIYHSYFDEQNELMDQKFKKYASYYHLFLKEWDSKPQREGFFGLRDYYNYLKYICEQINRNINQGKQGDQQNILARSIQINFDGQPQSVQLFNKISNTKNLQPLIPEQLVLQNLKSRDSRCLLLIVKGDSLIPIINKCINKERNQNKVICIYGSTFKDDQQSQQYNLQITSLIISHISKGNILAFKDINSSIQTSLYQLFNKSFLTLGEKKYCRIAVGANSNPKCFVHPDFNAIVYIDHKKIESTDLAFLNRFQKHYLDFNSMITPNERKNVFQIQEWIKGILQFKDNTQLKQQNYLMNSCQQSIATLIIKFRGNQNILQQVKKKILQNRTLDFQIAVKTGKIDEIYSSQLQELLKDQKSLDKENQKDKIIYTYDQSSQIVISKTSDRIRLAQIKKQSQLRAQLQKFFKSENKQLKLYISYQKQWYHINLVLYLVNYYQEQFSQKQKNVNIIIQLHRCTLLTSTIEHINISYLHNFEQYFAQDLVNNKQTVKLLQCKNYLQLFSSLNFQTKFLDLNASAHRRFKFISEANDVELVEAYFKQSNHVLKNQTYLNTANKYLKYYLDIQKINFSELLQNKEDILRASNVKQGIIFLLQEKCIDILSQFFRKIIQNNLLFNFSPQQLIFLLKKRFASNIQILKKDFEKEENLSFYKKIVEDLVQKAVKLQHEKQTTKNLKGIQSNRIEIIQPTLFPLSKKQLSYILKKQNGAQFSLQTVQCNSKKIFQIYSNYQQSKQENQSTNDTKFKQEDIQLEIKQIFSTINNLFKQKTNFRSLSQRSYFNELKMDNEMMSNLFLFDIITQFCKEFDNIQKKYIYGLFSIFLASFGQLDIEKKILLLTLDRNFCHSSFQILAICLSYSSIDQAQKIICPFINIKDSKQIISVEFPKYLIDFGNGILEFCSKLLEITPQNIQTLRMQNYLTLFAKISIPIKQFVVNYYYLGISILQQFYSSASLLQIMKKIYKSQMKKHFEDFVGHFQLNHLYKKIYIYMSKQLKNRQMNSDQINTILSYLCRKNLTGWYAYGVSTESIAQRQQCIYQFIQMTNTYTEIANNSSFFFQQILKQVSDQKKLFNHILNQDIHTSFREQWKLKIINQAIDFRNNFSVCLGNFFYQNIFNYIIQEEKQERDKCDVLKMLFKNFKQIIMFNNKNNIQYLLNMQFCKICSIYYIEKQSQKHKYQQLISQFNEIDKSLCGINQISRHLKIYILKQLYIKKNKDISSLKRQFIEKNRFQWIKQYKQMLTYVPKNESILPPNLNNTQKINKLIQEFRQNHYESLDKFHQIVSLGFQNQYYKYQLLNFFMMDVYTDIMPRDLKIKYLDQFNQRRDVIQNWWNLQIDLIRRYFNQNVTESLKFTHETNEQIFKLKHLRRLMSINCMILLKDTASSYLEMFFSQDNNVRINFSKQLEKMFLVGGKLNPQVQELKKHLKNQDDQKYKYYKCSQTCDYVFSAINKYKILNMKEEQIKNKQCPLCENIIQVNESNHLMSSFIFGSSSKIQYSQLRHNLIQAERKKQFVSNGVTHRLAGYSMGLTLEQIKQNQQKFSFREDSITIKFLNFITMTLWNYLTQINYIPNQQMKKALKLKQECDPIKFLNQASNYYSQKMMNSFAKEENLVVQDSLVWQLAIIKKIFLFLNRSKYLRQYSYKKKYFDLQFSDIRDKFQQQISQHMLKYYGGKQKQKLLLQERRIRRFKQENSDIIKERDNQNFASHYQKYPLLRIFKFNQFNLAPSYEKMISQYRPRLQKEYPMLYFMVQKKQNLKMAENYKKIWIFISKITKIAQFKITRQYAKQTSIQTFVDDFFGKAQSIRSAKQELKEFCNIWNSLVKSKFNLQGKYHAENQICQLVFPKSYLISILPDNKYKSNRDGIKVLALLSALAADYNNLCDKFKKVSQSISNDRDYKQGFGFTKINPSFAKETSKMLYYPEKQLKNIVKQNSCFSVEYGFSVPYYALNQIESSIIKNYYGCKYAIEDIEEYNKINYFGQLTHCIAEVRVDPKQISLREDGSRHNITQEIIKLQNNKEELYKVMKNLQGSLQNIMVYYKTATDLKIEIKKFIKGIHGLNKQIFEDPYGLVKIQAIADFYEIIQMSTFEQIEGLLHHSYKKQLSQQEKRAFLNLKQKMQNKREQDKTLPNYYDFQVAFYRFVSRRLLLIQCQQNQTIYEFVGSIQSLWPKKLKLKEFTDEDFKNALQIDLSKAGSILQMISVPKIQQMKKQNRFNRQLRQNNQMKNAGNRIMQTIETGFNQYVQSIGQSLPSRANRRRALNPRHFS